MTARRTSCGTKATAVDALVRRVQSRGAAVSFFVLDACRDNPLAASGVRSIGGTRGLTRVDTPNGVFVLFSAGIGQTALDRLGDDDPDPNSVFTRKLVPLLKTPGLTQVSLAKRVQREVDALSSSVHHPQQPAYYDQIIGEIELSPAMVPAPPAQPSAPAPQPSPPSQQIAVATPPAQVAPPKPVEPAVITVPRPEGIKQYKPGDSFKDCDQCPEMVVMPPGIFTMGSPSNEKGRRKVEGPQHKVTITTAFAVSKYEVTRDEFEAFVNESSHDAGKSCWTLESNEPRVRAGRSFMHTSFQQDGSHPAVCVSWSDATAFARLLSQKTRVDYRLLTEAEWEYVARAGSNSRFSFGTDEAAICDHENLRDLTTKEPFRATASVFAKCTDGYLYTSPAGTFASNGFGLYDINGNASEWVEDCWHENYARAPSDGSAWTSAGDCSRRVVRGGSWGNEPADLRSATRWGVDLGDHASSIGFRVARVLNN
jgi:formylglycine-generating enzyme required for sulfatase activity